MGEPEPGSLIGRTLGGCRVEALLGSGGMGEVYRAQQERLSRAVALKVLPARVASDPEYRNRFVLEARTAARIDHPNVVTIHDVGEEEGLLYLVLQLVRGGDLAAHAAAHRLTPAEVAGIGLAIARALSAAWAEGIVHLDVKPQNVLRSEHGDWLLSDFGIARLVHASPASAATEPAERGVSGSPPYMAPEQWEGRDVDGRTDLYALGIMLYTLLAGRLPFELPATPGIAHLYAAHIESPPRPLRALAPEVPEALARLIERLIAKRRSGRPASAIVVAEELEAMLAPGGPLADAASRGPAVAAAGGLRTPSEPGSAPLHHPFTATGRQPPFVAREPELAAVAAALDRAAAEGTGAVLLFAGPRGCGKSRLLHEAGRAAAEAGRRVLRGRARRLRPLSAVREVLRRLFRLDIDASPARLQRRLRRGLARASGEDGIAAARAVLEPFLLGETLSLEQPQTALPAPVLAGLIAREAKRARPLLVTIDDLDRADRCTREVIGALVGHCGDAPIVLAASVATGPAADEVAQQLAENGEVDRWPLARLQTDQIRDVAIAALGDATLPLPLAEALAKPAAGLPKVAVAAARDALRRGVIVTRDGAASGDTQALGALAQTFAERVERTRGTLAERLATATAAGAAPPRPTPSALRRVERQLRRGLRLRSFFDLAGAKAEIDGALARLPDGAPGALEARVRRELARTLRQAGEGLQTACALAARAAELSRADEDPAAACAAQIEHALALYLQRRYDDALAEVVKGEADHAAIETDRDDEDDAADGRRHALAAELAHARGLIRARQPGEQNAREATAAFEEAFHEAAAAGDQSLYARVCQSAGEAIGRLGDLRDAERLLRLSVRYKERQGDLPGLAMAYGGLARIARQRGEEQAAIDWYERDLAISRKIGDHRGAGVAANSMGEIHEERFLREPKDRESLARADEAFRQGLVCARRSRNALDDAIAGFYTGRFLCRCKGADPDASRAAREAATAEGIATLERSRQRFLEQGAEGLAAKVDAALAHARGGEAAR